MTSQFFGIEIARRAMDAQRRAMEVAGHNIANANTRGYSRQRVSMTTTPPLVLHGAGERETIQVGTGVRIEDIRRIRNAFLDFQARKAQAMLGQWQTREQILSEVEALINEPSEAGLRSVLDQFWESLQELANNPESRAVRTTVIKQAGSLAVAFRHHRQVLTELVSSINLSIEAKIGEINATARQLAAVNEQIQRAVVAGQSPNDLMDERDRLVEQLAKSAGAVSMPSKNHTVHVLVGGGVLVSGNNFQQIELLSDGTLKWQGLALSVKPEAGQIAGYLQMRDHVIPSLIGDIDTLAASVISYMNATHRSGFDRDGNPGEDFFVGSGAWDIAVSPVLAGNPDRIAASGTGDVGDGSVALRMARFRQEPIVSGASVDDFFRGFIAGIGVLSQEAKRLSENQMLLVEQIEYQRESISGVSLDEEVAELLKYQHAFNAAARVINSFDEMLEVIIERMGRVGR
ncbi:MAG: flagellar hook-associated protein FlgK [Bacillota bacterium]